MEEDGESPEFTVEKLIELVDGGGLEIDQLKAAISELGVLDDERAVPVLVSATFHESEFVRADACNALSSFSTTESMEAIQELRSDPKRLVRMSAGIAHRTQQKQPSRAGRKWRKTKARRTASIIEKRITRDRLLTVIDEALPEESSVAKVECEPALGPGGAGYRILVEPLESGATRIELKVLPNSIGGEFGQNGARTERVSVRKSKRERAILLFEESVRTVIRDGYIEYTRGYGDDIEAVGSAGQLETSNDGAPKQISKLPSFDEFPLEGWDQVVYRPLG